MRRTLRRTLRWIAPLLVFLAAACGSAGPYAQLHTSTESTTLTQPLTRIVFDDMSSSNLTLRPAKGTAVEVTRKLQWRGDKPPVYTETFEGQTLHVSARCEVLRCSIDYIVELPENTEIQAKVTSGDVDVSGITGPVSVESTSGDVKLTRVKSNITVKATSGDVSTSDLAAAQVDVTATSGDIDLDFAAAPQTVTAHATSGDITILVPSHDAYRVEVKTSSGDQTVSVDRTESAERKISAEATSGDVRIGYA